jgi:hypothetical protein
MRAVLALGLLITLCASADAARVHRSKPRHVIVRPSQVVDPRFPRSSKTRPLGTTIPPNSAADGGADPGCPKLDGKT